MLEDVLTALVGNRRCDMAITILPRFLNTSRALFKTSMGAVRYCMETAHNT